jgi:putative alpha-1,2-mannosidase
MKLLSFILLSTILSGLAVAAEPKSPADYVEPRIDTHKSRWFYFSSACRPFGMVNLSPDTRTGDDWMHGYVYGDTKIRCFSHIHGWQLYGIAVLPVTGDVHKPWDMDATAAEFSNKDEVVYPGYHKVFLTTKTGASPNSPWPWATRTMRHGS